MKYENVLQKKKKNIQYGIIFRLLYIWTSKSKHHLRVIFPVLRAECYVGLQNTTLWIFIVLIISTYLTFG